MSMLDTMRREDSVPPKESAKYLPKEFLLVRYSLSEVTLGKLLDLPLRGTLSRTEAHKPPLWLGSASWLQQPGLHLHQGLQTSSDSIHFFSMS